MRNAVVQAVADTEIGAGYYKRAEVESWEPLEEKAGTLSEAAEAVATVDPRLDEGNSDRYRVGTGVIRFVAAQMHCG